MSDRIAVFNDGRIQQLAGPTRPLRAARERLRGGLRRREQPPFRHGRNNRRHSLPGETGQRPRIMPDGRPACPGRPRSSRSARKVSPSAKARRLHQPVLRARRGHRLPGRPYAASPERDAGIRVPRQAGEPRRRLPARRSPALGWSTEEDARALPEQADEPNGRPKKETTMRPTVKPLIPKLFAVLVCAGTALVHASAARAQDKVTYQLGWIPTGEYAPYFAGVAKGFYKQEGIDLGDVARFRLGRHRKEGRGRRRHAGRSRHFHRHARRDPREGASEVPDVRIYPVAAFDLRARE